ncbi:hypothetical protein HK102_010721, partial [Quaeritorhiza haematococci]
SRCPSGGYPKNNPTPPAPPAPPQQSPPTSGVNESPLLVTNIPFFHSGSDAASSALEQLLKSGAQLVKDLEPGTLQWFALRNENDTTNFAIFDTFQDKPAKDAHFSGKVAAALQESAAQNVRGGFQAVLNAIQPATTLTNFVRPNTPATKATMVLLTPKPENLAEVEAFLKQGAQLVSQTEPKTSYWTAIKFDDGNAGRVAIFDTFTDQSGREAHFNGQVAAALVANQRLFAKDVLSEIVNFDILSAKL